MSGSKTETPSSDVPRLPATERSLALACILVFSIQLALALLGCAQIISVHEWCSHDAARQFGWTDTGHAQLRLGTRPAVVCQSNSGSAEIPIAPSVITILVATLGLVVSLFTVTRAVRRIHR